MENGSDTDDLRVAVKLNSEAVRLMTRLVEDLNVQLRIFSKELAELGARLAIYEQGLQEVQALVQGKGGLLSQMEVAQESMRTFREDRRISHEDGRFERDVRRENARWATGLAVSILLAVASLGLTIASMIRGVAD